jgi:hypothetical protein
MDFQSISSAPWIDTAQERVPFPLPRCFRDLFCRYVFSEFEISGLHHYDNYEVDEDWCWHTALFRDEPIFARSATPRAARNPSRKPKSCSPRRMTIPQSFSPRPKLPDASNHGMNAVIHLGNRGRSAQASPRIRRPSSPLWLSVCSVLGPCESSKKPASPLHRAAAPKSKVPARPELPLRFQRDH